MNDNIRFLIFLSGLSLWFALTLPMASIEADYVNILNEKSFVEGSNSVFGFNLSWNQSQQARLEKAELDFARYSPLWGGVCLVTLLISAWFFYPSARRLLSNK